MATPERRRKLTIDEINEYWRRLTHGYERPEVHKLCNAIRVLDVALADSGSSMNKKLSTNSWSKIRNDLFDTLITSFSGYFVMYDSPDESPCEAGSRWPANGVVEFYPEKTNRRDDSCHASVIQVHPSIALRLRWNFAEGHQSINPIDFAAFKETAGPARSGEQEEEAQLLLEQLYTTCANEASKLKKIAHRKWWQLHHQSSTCADRRQRGELRRQMDELELVWGRSQ